MSLKITPLVLGSLQMSGAVLQHLNHFEEDIFPCIGYVITGGDKIIIVDTGAPEPDCGVKTRRKVLREDNEYLVPQLASLNLKPEDIDIIINTHLHWDHIYGNNKMPNAEIIVQQKEVDYYNNPLPYHRNSYEKNSETPFVSTFMDRIKTVDGDAEIIPGVMVILTPGHTPGSQSVLVDTGEELVLLPGDNITLFSSINGDSFGLPGIYVNAYDCLATQDKLGSLSKYKILPAHDPAVIQNGAV